jgi:hypothetical protein
MHAGLGVPGQLVERAESGAQVWTGPLSGGRYAAVLVNTLDRYSRCHDSCWAAHAALTGIHPCTRLRVRGEINGIDHE